MARKKSAVKKEYASLQQTQEAFSRKYECVLLVRPELTQDQVRIGLIKDIEEIVEKQKGTVFVREPYLLTQLQVPVKKHKRGIYVVLNITCPPGLVDDLKRYLNLYVPVLLSMISSVDSFEEGPTAIGRKGGFTHYDRDEGGEGSGEQKRSYGHGHGHNRRPSGEFALTESRDESRLSENEQGTVGKD